jgi:hypothetical protein
MLLKIFYLKNKKICVPNSNLQIDIESMPDILYFISFSLLNFSETFKSFYNLNNNENFDIKNIHILKLNNNKNKLIENKYDLTIKILLNNDDNFKIILKNNNLISLNKGDSMTHPPNFIQNIIPHYFPCYILMADIVYK